MGFAVINTGVQGIVNNLAKPTHKESLMRIAEQIATIRILRK